MNLSSEEEMGSLRTVLFPSLLCSVASLGDTDRLAALASYNRSLDPGLQKQLIKCFECGLLVSSSNQVAFSEEYHSSRSSSDSSRNKWALVGSSEHLRNSLSSNLELAAYLEACPRCLSNHSNNNKIFLEACLKGHNSKWDQPDR